jgi:hypothetical protein
MMKAAETTKALHRNTLQPSPEVLEIKNITGCP